MNEKEKKLLVQSHEVGRSIKNKSQRCLAVRRVPLEKKGTRRLGKPSERLRKGRIPGSSAMPSPFSTGKPSPLFTPAGGRCRAKAVRRLLQTMEQGKAGEEKKTFGPSRLSCSQSSGTAHY